MSVRRKSISKCWNKSRSQNLTFKMFINEKKDVTFFWYTNTVSELQYIFKKNISNDLYLYMHLLGSEDFFQDSCSPNIVHELAAPIGGLGPRKSWFLSTFSGKYAWYHPPKGFFSTTDGRYGSFVLSWEKHPTLGHVNFSPLWFFGTEPPGAPLNNLGIFFSSIFLSLQKKRKFRLFRQEAISSCWCSPNQPKTGSFFTLVQVKASMGPKRVRKNRGLLSMVIWDPPWISWVSERSRKNHHRLKFFSSSTQKNCQLGKGGYDVIVFRGYSMLSANF